MEPFTTVEGSTSEAEEEELRPPAGLESEETELLELEPAPVLELTFSLELEPTLSLELEFSLEPEETELLDLLKTVELDELSTSAEEKFSVEVPVEEFASKFCDELKFSSAEELLSNSGLFSSLDEVPLSLPQAENTPHKARLKPNVARHFI